MCAARLAQHNDDFRQSQSLSDRGQIVPEQSSPLSSKSSASTQNPKFTAGFSCSSPAFSSSSLRGPNLLSWFVFFAVAVEPSTTGSTGERFGVADSSVSPLHLRRPDALFIARRGRDLDNPLQAMAISGRPYSIDCDGRRPFLGSAADRGKAASWAPRAGGLGSPTVETWEGWEREWGRIISTMP